MIPSKIPEVLAQIRGPHAVIEASAGTGKTFTLGHLVLDLIVAKQIPIERILIVTFTEKAAGELRERVGKLLTECVNETPDTPEHAEDLQRLIVARSNFERATIGTIHSYCQKALREIAFDAGRPFALELTTTAPLAEQAFRSLYRTDFASNPALTEAFAEAGPPALFAAVEQVRSKGLPIAPTAEETAAAVAQLPSTVALQSAKTAALAAAGRMKKEPVADVFQALIGGVYADAYQAFSALTDAQRRLFDEIDEARFGGAVARALPYVAAGADPKIVALQHMLAPIAARIAEKKREEGLVDFDDLVGLVAEALEPGTTEASNAAAEAVAETLRGRHDAALLDEFQDTDAKQWRIFRALFLRPDKRLYLVGDPKQAIYRFRGGDLPTYLHAVATIAETQGQKPIPLAVNYRSTAPLIAATNAILATDFFHGQNRYPYPVSAGQKKLALLDAAGAPLAPILAPTARGPKKAPSRVRRRRVLAAVAEALHKTIAEGTLVDKEGRIRPLSWKDVFVLVGTKTDGAAVAKAFREHGIPATRYKEEGLFQTREASDLHDLLSSLANPNDRTREIRAYQTLFFGCDADDLEALAVLPETHPLVLLRLRLRDLALRGTGALFAELLHLTGARARLLLAEAGVRRLVNLEHLLEIVGEAARATDLEGVVRLFGTWVRGEATPAAHDDRQLVMRVETGGRDAVQILTMHAAKGLERPVVALVSLGKYLKKSHPVVFSEPALRRAETKGFPEAERQTRQWVATAIPSALAEGALREDAEEAERVAYVALTRASHRTIVPLWIDEETETLVDLGLRSAPYSAPLRGALANGTPGILQLETSTLIAERLARRSPENAGILEDTAPAFGDTTPEPLPIVPFEIPQEEPLYTGDRDAHAFVLRILRDARPRRAHSFTSLTALASPRDFAATDGEVVTRGDVDDALLEEDEVLGADISPGTAPVADLATLDGLHPELPLNPTGGHAGPRWGDFVHRLIEASFEQSPATDASKVLGSGAPPGRDKQTAFCTEMLPLLRPIAEAAGYDDVALSEALPLVFAAFSARLVPRFDDLATHTNGLTARFSVGEIPRDRLLPELEFQLGLTNTSDARDRLVGSIDLALEHDGRIHLIDWKTNRLAQYDSIALAANVADHYALQIAVYTLAAVRHFELDDESAFSERFGGVHYVYLRGVRSEDVRTGDGEMGVYTMYPTFADVSRWKRELAARVHDVARRRDASSDATRSRSEHL